MATREFLLSSPQRNSSLSKVSSGNQYVTFLSNENFFFKDIKEMIGN